MTPLKTLPDRRVDWRDPSSGNDRFAMCDTDEAGARGLAKRVSAEGMEGVDLMRRIPGSARWESVPHDAPHGDGDETEGDAG